MRADERLGWYAQHFDMVEVNSTFYSVPDLRMVERWCAGTPDRFTFDVKLHQLFSFHSTAAKLLPPDLQQRAETDGKGKVKLTPALEEAMLGVFLRSVSILHAAGKLGVLLLQLSPAFSPRKHQLSECLPILMKSPIQALPISGFTDETYVAISPGKLWPRALIMIIAMRRLCKLRSEARSWPGRRASYT